MLSAAPNIEQNVVDDRMAGLLRTKSPAERLAIAHGMWRSAARMIQCMLRSEHPDWSDDQIHCEAARRLSHGAG
jgi:hypothetical protein